MINLKISEKFNQGKTVLSFEIFPPKKQEEIKNVEPLAAELKELNPDFVSVTCGAGGSGGKNTTIEVASILKNRYGIETMAHLTCIGADFDGIKTSINAIKAENIDNVLALRGDVPKGMKAEDVIKDYDYAYQLINDIKGSSDLGIGAAAYPEAHIACENFEDGITHLKQKQDCGAEFFVTQLCFDNDIIYRFLDKAAQGGVNVPITLGIMPMMSRAQVERMIFMCGATLPSQMIKIINKYGENADDLMRAGIEYAEKQVSGLKANNVDGVHIYCMNKPEVAKALINA